MGRKHMNFKDFFSAKQHEQVEEEKALAPPAAEELCCQAWSLNTTFWHFISNCPNFFYRLKQPLSYVT